ncbi:spore coat protein [Clostridium sp. OS1-26]|uniref:spore coat protein n=1 Tax=Clostridium sp. OS1-26 TaxID=3070681 RepID=UPI0027E0CDBD|nr:spore coat protein [Clostridium sp. OS1-26]WML35093.1 spore coat protein [Clostridium sp. OS1-26]
MSWLDDLFGVDDTSGNGSNPNPNDKDVAIDMLTLSKNRIRILTKAAVEATNPQLRQILSCELTNSINEHFRLSDMAVNKQWYNAFADPVQQIQQDVVEAQNISQNQ